MADIDIDPFGDHEKTYAQADETGKTIPLNPRGVGEATLEPEHKQGTSHRRKTQESDPQKCRLKNCI